MRLWFKLWSCQEKAQITYIYCISSAPNSTSQWVLEDVIIQEDVHDRNIAINKLVRKKMLETLMKGGMLRKV